MREEEANLQKHLHFVNSRLRECEERYRQDPEMQVRSSASFLFYRLLCNSNQLNFICIQKLGRLRSFHIFIQKYVDK